MLPKKPPFDQERPKVDAASMRSWGSSMAQTSWGTGMKSQGIGAVDAMFPSGVIEDLIVPSKKFVV